MRLWCGVPVRPSALRRVVLAGAVAIGIPACGTNLVLDFGDAGVGGSSGAGGGSSGGTSGAAAIGGSSGGGAAGQSGSGGNAGSAGGGGTGIPITDAGATRDAGDAALDASN
jgi:hypothetical protein